MKQTTVLNKCALEKYWISYRGNPAWFPSMLSWFPVECLRAGGMLCALCMRVSLQPAFQGPKTWGEKEEI